MTSLRANTLLALESQFNACIQRRRGQIIHFGKFPCFQQPTPKEPKPQLTAKTPGGRPGSTPAHHTSKHQPEPQAQIQPHFAFNQQYPATAFPQVCRRATLNIFVGPRCHGVRTLGRMSNHLAHHIPTLVILFPSMPIELSGGKAANITCIPIARERIAGIWYVHTTGDAYCAGARRLLLWHASAAVRASHPGSALPWATPIRPSYTTQCVPGIYLVTRANGGQCTVPAWRLAVAIWRLVCVFGGNAACGEATNSIIGQWMSTVNCSPIGDPGEKSSRLS